MKYPTQKKLMIIGFLVIPVALMLIFLAYPAASMLVYSFTNWDGVLPDFSFIGFENYTRALTEDTLWISLKNNLVYAVLGIVQNVAALFMAVVLKKKSRFNTISKFIIFLPYVLNVTAVAYMFNYIFDFREGPINILLRFLDQEPVRFFSDANIAIYTLVFMSNWRWLGYTVIIYIAAMQSIDAELYEAAEIDGADTWTSFWRITLPNIQLIVELQLFLALIGSLQAFTESLVLTKGGPSHATYTFMYYVIDSYTYFNDYGYAAALSVLLILLIVIITRIQKVVLNQGVLR